MDLLIWIIEHSAGVKYEVPSTIEALKSKKYLAQSLKSTFFKVIVPQMEKGVCWEKQNSWKKPLILASNHWNTQVMLSKCSIHFIYFSFQAYYGSASAHLGHMHSPR